MYFAPIAKDGILNIRPHMIAAHTEQFPIINVALNSNESAHGASPYAIQAARAAVTGIERYCENPAQFLVPAIAHRFKLRQDYIAIGHGSDDLLARLARAYLEPGSELIRSENGYLKVPNYAYANGAIPVSAPDHNFCASVDQILKRVTDKTRVVYLANPDNPSGTYLNSQEILRLHSGLPDNVLLILDCAYEEYVDVVDYEPTHRLVESAANVVMTRTFSKIFGLAGARVGWLYSQPHIIDVVNRIALTFPLSSPSLAAAIVALEDKTHTKTVYEATISLRTRFRSALENNGLIVYPSQANFVLVRFPSARCSAEGAYTFLRQHGISTRRFAATAFAECIRITLGQDQEVKRAQQLLLDYLAEP